MHNHVGHRWIKTFLKQLKLASRIYLSTAIVLSPIFFINSANASTLAGGSGWRVASTVANGVGVTVNGVKDIIVNGASKTVTGVANVTPSAAQVGKFMGKNLGAAAVVGAVDLLLDGVDWVIDEGGKVTKKNTDTPFNDPSVPYYYSSGGFSSSSESGLASKILSDMQRTFPGVFVSSRIDKSNPALSNILICRQDGNCNQYQYEKVQNPDYNPAAPIPENVPINDREGKPLTLVSLGQMVIDQAQEEVRTGNPAVPIATPVTQAAATAVVGEAATDETQARPITAELDKSVAIPTTETAVGEIAPPTTNPDTGEVKPGSISLDFPVFCSWAPSMCVLADKVQEAITDAREWAKNDENQDTDNEPPEIKEIDIEALDTSTFTGVAGCPAPIVVPISFGDGGETEISYEPICQLAEKWSFVAPLIGFLSGAMIIVGVGRKGEDGEI
jgi:hypothetical protein